MFVVDVKIANNRYLILTPQIDKGKTGTSDTNGLV